MNLDLQPKPGLTIVQGQNAQGKTNFLEAISLLSIPQPLRVRSLADCVSSQAAYFDIQAQFQNHEALNALDEVFENYNLAKSLRLFYELAQQKAMFKNQVAIPAKNFVGQLKVVIFTPEDIELLSHSPGNRRRFIDRLLVQSHSQYYKQLGQYSRVLKSRNLILKDPTNHATIQAYDQLLSQHACQVWAMRLEFYQFLSEQLASIYQNISSCQSKIRIDFKTIQAENLQPEYILDKLKANFQRDQITKYTNFGPHRDDFRINMDGHSIKDFGSRGERRSMVIALKIAELEFLKSKSLFTPILLLDDVFSELDATRRYQLLDLAQGYQTIISTVETTYFAKLAADSYQLVQLENGALL